MNTHGNRFGQTIEITSQDRINATVRSDAVPVTTSAPVTLCENKAESGGRVRVRFYNAGTNPVLLRTGAKSASAAVYVWRLAAGESLERACLDKVTAIASGGNTTVMVVEWA